MNINENKNVGSAYILAMLVAIIGCIYVVIVSLGSMRDANASTAQAKISTPEVANISTEDEAGSDSDADLITVSENSSVIVKEIIEIAKLGSTDLDITVTPEPLKKTVVLTDNTDKKFGEVCFSAADDSVFMSYGWVGLAQLALTELGDKRSIDDIKSNLDTGCNDSLGEAIHLEYNNAVIATANEDF